jgi:hypothetical protein
MNTLPPFPAGAHVAAWGPYQYPFTYMGAMVAVETLAPDRVAVNVPLTTCVVAVSTAPVPGVAATKVGAEVQAVEFVVTVTAPVGTPPLVTNVPAIAHPTPPPVEVNAVGFVV